VPADDEGGSRRGGFWATLPGILTGIAAVIGSTAGLVAIFHGGGGDSGDDSQASALVVPNVVEEPQSEARAIIRRRDLDVGRVTRACSDQPEGTVMSQRPDAGAPADRATAVSLTVSSGERPGEISFPSKGAALPDAYGVRGHVCALPAGRHVWLLTRTDGLYPAEEVDGDFSEFVDLGPNRSDVRNGFAHVLLVVGPSGHRVIDAYAKAADYDRPLRDIPGSTVLDTVDELTLRSNR